MFIHVRVSHRDQTREEGEVGGVRGPGGKGEGGAKGKGGRGEGQQEGGGGTLALAQKL